MANDLGHCPVDNYDHICQSLPTSIDVLVSATSVSIALYFHETWPAVSPLS